MNDSTTTASLSGRLFKASCVAAIAYVIMTFPFVLCVSRFGNCWLTAKYFNRTFYSTAHVSPYEMFVFVATVPSIGSDLKFAVQSKSDRQANQLSVSPPKRPLIISRSAGIDHSLWSIRISHPLSAWLFCVGGIAFIVISTIRRRVQ